MTAKRLFAMCMSLLALVVVACAENVDMGTVRTGDTPGFTDPDGGRSDAPVRIFACMGTDCPAPFATCLSEDGPAYKCGTDLSRDSDNCGACGNECPHFSPTNMTSRCIEGACELECFTDAAFYNNNDWKNCNKLVDDGCETDILNDKNHCGACGNECKDGDPCIEGKCGCPTGKTACDGFCVDLNSDDSNCGACGTQCDYAPAGACDPTPPNSRYGCVAGVCDQLKCNQGAADCDGDLQQCDGNGCELNNIDNNEHCGACFNKCDKPGEICVDEGSGPECAIPCKKFGKTFCGVTCVDLLNDPFNCGACGNGCNRAGDHQARTCNKGVCAYECETGFADCNGDPTDGCEVDLRIHPNNCGACGNACNFAAGQPCVEGKCLMKECEPGQTQ